MSTLNGVEVWGLSETLTFMAKAEKNTKAVRRQRHKTKSYFSLHLVLIQCGIVSLLLSPLQWGAVCGARTWLLPPLKLFPIHSPPHPPPSPTTGASSRLLPLSQINERSFQKDGGGETHPFVRSSCILSRLPFPQGSVCPLSEQGCQQVCKCTLPTRRGAFVLTPPESFYPLNSTPVADVALCTGPGEIP